MAIADNGGFDLTVELPAEMITLAARTMTIPAGSRVPINAAGLMGEITLSLRVSEVRLIRPNLLWVSLGLTGTQARITEFMLLGRGTVMVPAHAQEASIGGQVIVEGELRFSGNDLIVDWSENPGMGLPRITPSPDHNVFLASLPANFLLAGVLVSDPTGTEYNETRAALLDALNTAITNAVRSRMSEIGSLLLARAPSLPPPVRISCRTFLIWTNGAIKLLYCLGRNVPGDPTLIGRSNLALRGDGSFLDRVTLILSNGAILFDFVRPAVTARLALPEPGFLRRHPLLWLGNTPAPIPLPPLFASISITSVAAGVDGTNLRLLVGLVAIGVGGAFTISAGVDTTFSVTAAMTAGELILTIAPVGSPLVRSTHTIAEWVYVSSFFTLGVGLTAVLGAIDLFSGSLLDGLIASSIAPFLGSTIGLPLSLPPSLPRLALRAQSLFQADSIPRTVLLSPSGFITDPFPAHDAIVNLV